MLIGLLISILVVILISLFFVWNQINMCHKMCHDNISKIIDILQDNRSKLLLKGVEECEHGTKWPHRQMAEMVKILSILKELDNTFDPDTVCGYRRLGKYNRDSEQPRPLEVRLNHQHDVLNLLSKPRDSLKSPITIEQYRTRSKNAPQKSE